MKEKDLKARDAMRASCEFLPSAVVLTTGSPLKENMVVGGKQARMKFILKIAFSILLQYNLTPPPFFLPFQRTTLPLHFQPV